MIIGSVPLATWPTTTGWDTSSPTPGPGPSPELGPTPPVEPVEIVRGLSFVWRVRLLVGGVDMTSLLTGSLDVDREEGAAGVAGFTLLLPPGPVVPPDWTGKSVELDYISTDRDGIVTTARLYTGSLEMPAWDSNKRMLSCECSDQRQDRVEALTIEQIDALIPASWSPDIFEPLEGRSRWDYAEERLSTVTASLDCSPLGALRLTSWFAGAPAFIYGPGTTLYNSVQIELQPQGAITNTVEIDASYRYQRLYQHNVSFGWTHPGMGGNSGINGFCNWRNYSTELPTTDMIEGAVTGSGLSLVGRVGGFKLPPSMSNPCGDGSPWINNFADLWLSATATGAQRWAQSVTERYTVTITAGVVGTPVINRQSASFEVETTTTEDWLAEPPRGNGSIVDVSDEARRVGFLTSAFARARSTLVGAHRGTTVSWQTPTDLALGVDLTHTLRLDDTAKATGKCRRIQHSIDLGSGRAVTTLGIAVMRGGGINTPLVIPPAPDTSLPPITASGGTLATQLGGLNSNPITGMPIPPYDEDRMGFSGNWGGGGIGEVFPRRFSARSIDIAPEYRDELKAEAVASYSIGIPQDQLEL